VLPFDPYRINNADINLFANARRLSTFTRRALCEMHIHGASLSHTHSLLCAICLIPHPTYFFHPSQRRKPPFQRHCPGMEGKVRLCRHLSYTMGELRGLSGPRSGGALRVCGHCELQKLVRCYYLKEAVCNTVLYRERGSRRDVRWRKCVEVLDNIDEWVCPHLCTGDERL
jgi:hypothetical protein